jgi:starvation-inducible DNA-binding protein
VTIQINLQINPEMQTSLQTEKQTDKPREKLKSESKDKADKQGSKTSSQPQPFTRAKMKADESNTDLPKSTKECVHFSRETPDYDLDKETIKNLGCVLHKFISMEMMLKTKAFGYLCNVTGPNWYSQHLLLEKIYCTLNKLFEKVALENRKFGLCVPTTLEEFIKLSHRGKNENQKKNSDPSPNEMFSELVKCNEEMIKVLDSDIERVAGDFKIKSTEDFLVEVLRKHKKINWMLRSTMVCEE